MLFDHLSRDSAAIRVEKVLAMLVESGFVYCCIWVRTNLSFFLFYLFPKLIRWDAQVLYLISTYRVLPDPWFAVMNASLVYFSVRKPPLLHRLNVFSFTEPLVGSFFHGQGLYPTVVFIFVVLRKSPTHTITKQHASAHFSDRPCLTTEETPVRIPMSIMCSTPEESHNTKSNLAELPSPSSPHLRDNKQLMRVGSS